MLLHYSLFIIHYTRILCSTLHAKNKKPCWIIIEKVREGGKKREGEKGRRGENERVRK
jgi:hypothetical protein